MLRNRMTRIAVSLFLGFFLLLPLAQLPALGATTYTVVAGDTLWKISVRYQVGIDEILQANPQIKNPDWIYVGQVLQLPANPPAGSSFEQQVFELTNAERVKAGLAPLRWNWELARVARFKSQDMRDRSYFSHNSPTYGSLFTMMKNFGIKYSAAGENIAAGYSSAQAVVQGWMNSSGHRQNILNPNFNQIGIGYAAGGSYRHYWTQMFIRG
ncbi:MAG: CAP domain-containing protein [Syntrophomonadaceae bacterium]|nr:CAP domain-containing protein [Syntrophomonadaceae bacterium]